MDALVLGGSRFIGLRLVQLLHAEGHTVTVLNRGATPTELPEGVATIRADREKPAEVAAALRGRTFDAAFDISAYVAKTLRPAVEALDGNVGSYVFCSTTAVYERSDRYPIRPDFPLERSPDASGYQKGKVDCEDLLREAHARSGFPVTMLRPPAVYGPYNTLPEREFSYFARLLRGKPIIIPGDPSALVQFAHVDDLAAAFLAAALTDRGVGNCYTICGEYSVSVDYWIRAVGRAVGRPVDVVYVPGDRFAELNRELGIGDTAIWPFGWGRSFFFSIDEAKRDLGWSPGHDIEHGLEMTYRWWRGRGLHDADWDFSKDDMMLSRLRKAG